MSESLITLQIFAALFSCIGNTLVAYSVSKSIPLSAIIPWVMVASGICWTIYAGIVQNYFLVVTAGSTALVHITSITCQRKSNARYLIDNSKFSDSETSLPQVPLTENR